jgi:hypothetical protein
MKEGGRSPSGWINGGRGESGRWCSSLNRGGGREQSREQGGTKEGGGGKGKSMTRCAPFIAVRGGGQRRYNSGHGLTRSMRSKRCSSDTAVDKRAQPRGFKYFPNYPNQLKFVK